ncbi:retron system putative HNH endonuclease [uncultured Oscillibacter sp.]|uniref:retron system putative HNH endonuclease n=1 Tax=uncultured Oscillibacter sp. TaxID=876091 RepID=UPI0025D5F900|nr:retron system putative HNH endonuclease [uncultured Oscillibacter sp.]
MKRIVKGKEPSDFTAWKEQFRQAHGKEPEYKDFRMTPEWKNLIQTLLKEQGYICCYCMQRIYGEDSHIEHFVPRDIKNTDPHSMRASDVELNYGNLFESCNGEHWDWSHCGRFKDRESDPILLSPAQEDIEERFCYGLDGSIDAVHADDSAAMSTIRILNLNDTVLKRHRRTAIFTALKNADPKSSNEALIDSYSRQDESGMFAPYCMAVIWALREFS